MTHSDSRQTRIEIYAGAGNIEEIKKLFELGFTKSEIDSALENAIAYSKIEMAEYLLLVGADISNDVYYAAHNNELEGLKFAINKGVDINVENGMLLNTSIETATNTKDIVLVQWLLDNGADPNLLTKKSLWLVNTYGNNELKNLIKKLVPVKYAFANQKYNKGKINQEQYRPIPLYMILLCGVIIVFIGIWLSVFNISANGISTGNKYGENAGKHIIITGPEAIFIGLGICAFPAIQLMKNKSK